MGRKSIQIINIMDIGQRTFFLQIVQISSNVPRFFEGGKNGIADGRLRPEHVRS